MNLVGVLDTMELDDLAEDFAVDTYDFAPLVCCCRFDGEENGFVADLLNIGLADVAFAPKQPLFYNHAIECMGFTEPNFAHSPEFTA